MNETIIKDIIKKAQKLSLKELGELLITIEAIYKYKELKYLEGWNKE